MQVEKELGEPRALRAQLSRKAPRRSTLVRAQFRNSVSLPRIAQLGSILKNFAAQLRKPAALVVFLAPSTKTKLNEFSSTMARSNATLTFLGDVGIFITNLKMFTNKTIRSR